MLHHHWFKGLDFDDVLLKKLVPSFVPRSEPVCATTHQPPEAIHYNTFEEAKGTELAADSDFVESSDPFVTF